MPVFLRWSEPVFLRWSKPGYPGREIRGLYEEFLKVRSEYDTFSMCNCFMPCHSSGQSPCSTQSTLMWEWRTLNGMHTIPLPWTLQTILGSLHVWNLSRKLDCQLLADSKQMTWLVCKVGVKHIMIWVTGTSWLAELKHLYWLDCWVLKSGLETEQWSFKASCMSTLKPLPAHHVVTIAARHLPHVAQHVPRLLGNCWPPAHTPNKSECHQQHIKAQV